MASYNPLLLLPMIFLMFSFSIAQAHLFVIGHQLQALLQKDVPTEQPILDLTVMCKGMCPDKPEVLIRLYENGEAEMTYYNYEERKHALRRLTLADEEVRNLIRLARAPGFLEANGKYEAITELEDSFYTSILKYEDGNYHKTVVLDNYDSQVPKASEYYPRALVELMGYIKQLRRKYLLHR